MKILTCPVNGPRNITEFVWGGEVKAMPDVAASDDAWTEYLFLETNPIPVKTALAMLGQIEEEVRLPLVGMSLKSRETLKATLKHCGILK